MSDGDDYEDDNAPFILDSLSLNGDASLAAFFKSLAELIEHGKEETLILSAEAHIVTIDKNALFRAKNPNAPLPQQNAKPANKAPSKPTSKQHSRATTQTTIPSTNSASAAASSTTPSASTMSLSMAVAVPLADGQIIRQANAPTSLPTSHHGGDNVSDPELMENSNVVDPEIVFAPPRQAEPPASPQQAELQSPQSFGRDVAQAELIEAAKRLANSKKKEQTKSAVMNALNPKQWFKIKSPTSSSSSSTAIVHPLAVRPDKTNGGLNASSQSSPSPASLSPTLSPTHSPRNSGKGARSTSPRARVLPTHESWPPSASSQSTTIPHTEAVTLLLSNLAVYILPPAISIAVNELSTKYFLVYNQYKRYALQDILLISLPYRSGLRADGTDYAMRINDFSMHLRSGRTVWLQSPRGKRSLVVEALSDAYSHLLGTPLDMHQPDYVELIQSILDDSIVTMIKAMRMEGWAHSKPAQTGWLIHQRMYENSSGDAPIMAPTHSQINKSNGHAPFAMSPRHDNKSSVISPTSSSATSLSSSSSSNDHHKHSDYKSWELRYFVLSTDHYLLHFRNPIEKDAFNHVILSAHSQIIVNSSGLSKINNKLPLSFDCTEIDLTRALCRRMDDNIHGFDILVFPTSTESINGAPVTDKGYTRHMFTVIPPLLDQQQQNINDEKYKNLTIQTILQQYQQNNNNNNNKESKINYFPSSHPLANIQLTEQQVALADEQVKQWEKNLQNAILLNQKIINNDDTQITSTNSSNTSVMPSLFTPIVSQTSTTTNSTTSNSIIADDHQRDMSVSFNSSDTNVSTLS